MLPKSHSIDVALTANLVPSAEREEKRWPVIKAVTYSKLMVRFTFAITSLRSLTDNPLHRSEGPLDESFGNFLR